MDIDQEHQDKLNAAMEIDVDGGKLVRFDIAFMTDALSRLTLWERGLLTQAILSASTAKEPTLEQRALLALFVSDREAFNDD